MHFSYVYVYRLVTTNISDENAFNDSEDSDHDELYVQKLDT